MTPISETLHELLVRQGIAQERTAIRQAQGMDAGAPEGKAHPLAARPGEDREPMGMGKTRATKARASFQEVGEIVSQEPSSNRDCMVRPVLHVIVDNSRCKPIHTPTRVAPRGIGFHLVLIEGGRK